MRGRSRGWPEPVLDLGDVQAAAGRVVLDLVAADPADGEVPRGGVGEQQAAHARRRRHRVGLGQPDAALVGAEQVEQLPLEAVVGTGRIAQRRPDAAEPLGVQLLDGRVGVRLVPGRAGLEVEVFGERLGQPVGQRLDHDGPVVVAGLLVAPGELLGAVDGHREPAQVVAVGRHVVGEATGWAGRRAWPSAAAASGTGCRPPGCRRPRRGRARNRTRPRPAASRRR